LIGFAYGLLDGLGFLPACREHVLCIFLGAVFCLWFGFLWLFLGVLCLVLGWLSFFGFLWVLGGGICGTGLSFGLLSLSAVFLGSLFVVGGWGFFFVGLVAFFFCVLGLLLVFFFLGFLFFLFFLVLLVGTLGLIGGSSSLMGLLFFTLWSLGMLRGALIFLWASLIGCFFLWGFGLFYFGVWAIFGVLLFFFLVFFFGVV
jgi:hypothetical protein